MPKAKKKNAKRNKKVIIRPKQQPVSSGSTSLLPLSLPLPRAQRRSIASRSAPLDSSLPPIDNQEGELLQKQMFSMQEEMRAVYCPKGRTSCCMCEKQFSRRLKNPLTCGCPQEKTYCSRACFDLDLNHHQMDCKNVEIELYEEEEREEEGVQGQGPQNQSQGGFLRAKRGMRPREKITSPSAPLVFFPKVFYAPSLNRYIPDEILPGCVGCNRTIVPGPVGAALTMGRVDRRIIHWQGFHRNTGGSKSRGDNNTLENCLLTRKCKICDWPVCDFKCAKGAIHIMECSLLKKLNTLVKDHPVKIDLDGAYLLLAGIRLYMLASSRELGDNQKFETFMGLSDDKQKLSFAQQNYLTYFCQAFRHHLGLLNMEEDPTGDRDFCREGDISDYKFFTRIFLHALDLSEISPTGLGIGVYPIRFKFVCSPNSLLELVGQSLAHITLDQLNKGDLITVSTWKKNTDFPAFAQPLVTRASFENRVLFGDKFCYCGVCRVGNNAAWVNGVLVARGGVEAGIDQTFDANSWEERKNLYSRHCTKLSCAGRSAPPMLRIKTWNGSEMEDGLEVTWNCRTCQNPIKEDNNPMEGRYLDDIAKLSRTEGQQGQTWLKNCRDWKNLIKRMENNKQIPEWILNRAEWSAGQVLIQLLNWIGRHNGPFLRNPREKELSQGVVDKMENTLRTYGIGGRKGMHKWILQIYSNMNKLCDENLRGVETVKYYGDLLNDALQTVRASNPHYLQGKGIEVAVNGLIQRKQEIPGLD